MRPSICVVSEFPPPPGGIAVQAQLLCANLRREGHTVTEVRTNALAADSPIRRYRGTRGIVNLALFMARIWPGCRKADCLHIFSSSYLGFFLFTMPAVAVGRLSGKRVIINYHGGAAREFLASWFWLARFGLQAADCVVVPSGFLRGIFAQFGIEARESPNVLDLSAFTFRERKPLHPRVIMSRHLEPPYNIACGMRAFALFAASRPAARLTVTGDGSERAGLERLAGELGISDRVQFLGNVANQGMPRLYDLHDIYLNSSRVDNQPVSIIEAFAAGLPVVSTDVGGIPHMIRHGQDGMLSADDDAPALAANLAAVLDHHDLAARLIANARSLVPAFSWELVYPKLIAYYNARAAA